MPTAFITGAGGFIGRYTVAEFLRRGWRVLALLHRRPAPPDFAAPERNGHLLVLRGDAADFPLLRALLRAGLAAAGSPGLEAIIHCAGRASDIGRRCEFRRANFEAVQTQVRLARELDVGSLVFVSSSDVYGLRDCHGEAEEELPLGARPRNPYPEFKIAAERLIREQLPPSRYALVRPSQVWGGGDPTLTPRIVAFLRHSPWIVHFGRWRGRNRWPLAHVRNVAAALFLAATHPEAAGQAITVLDEERTTMEEWYRLLAGIYLPQKKFRSVALPLWLGRAFGLPVSALSNLLNRERPLTDPSYYALFAVSHNLDFGRQRLAALFKATAYRPVTREAGLQELRDSLRGQADMVHPPDL